jgi:hypothetical protein
VHLDPEQAIMTITTTYELVSGDAKTIGVWTITQLKEPVSIFVPLPQDTKRTNSFTLLGKEPPPDLRTLSLGITTGDAKRNVLCLSRDPKASYKIGTEAITLLWIGEKAALRIDSERLAQAEYPDQGSSAEIYTNPDPLRYIELEMLGPLRKLMAGDRIHHTNTYRLFRRSETSPDAEAHILMK